MDPETTDNLTRAVAAWVSMAAQQLAGEQVAVLQACVHGTARLRVAQGRQNPAGGRQ